MADAIRFLGLITGAFALGGVIQLALAPPGTTGFRVPWRYWACAAGGIIEVSGLYARFDLWGEPLSYRDVTFLLANVCIIVTCIGTLRSLPLEGGET